WRRLLRELAAPLFSDHGLRGQVPPGHCAKAHERSDHRGGRKLDFSACGVPRYTASQAAKGNEKQPSHKGCLVRRNVPAPRAHARPNNGYPFDSGERPTIQIYEGATRARGGIAITASHNPPEYNALKLFNSEGLFFNSYERGELLDLYHQSDFRRSTNAEIRRATSDYASAPRMHIERVLRHVDVARIRQRHFRVALDAVNGAGSIMTAGFLRDTLGCDLHAISIDPTKPFPRIAEPRPDTLGDLSNLVRSSGAEIGFAQDPDGDRLAVADETGRVFDNDDVLALAVDAALRRLPGDVVVN